MPADLAFKPPFPGADDLEHWREETDGTIPNVRIYVCEHRSVVMLVRGVQMWDVIEVAAGGSWDHALLHPEEVAPTLTRIAATHE